MRRLRDEAYVEYRMPGVAVTRVEEPEQSDAAPASPETTEESAAEVPPASPDAREEPTAELPPASPDTPEDSTAELPPELPDARDEPAAEPADGGEESPYVVGDPGAP
jgi:hypothetical protein